ncbi:GNAT family N-acetyltransferase [Shimia ponticola]|uniref:GNAT family N-acetyltransferase n=1 Tax=Shimia ponticola TaxID=2582893 RepID=UPI0011BF6963|nr:GNAT family N-acetyltransferase [Shimia ponticola]
MADFDIQPVLHGDRLTLEPLRGDHREALYRAANEPSIWAQHPAWTRHERVVFDPYFDFLLKVGGTLVVIDRDAERVIGCSRYYSVPDHPEEWAIGYTFLHTDYWGGSWNRELKALMVEHAFVGVDRIWFHIAPDNIRSQIATIRLGAVFEYDANLDLGAGPTPTKCYTLTPSGWSAAIRS